MVKGDDALEAEELLSNDQRFVIQGWDGQRLVGEAFARTLKLNCPAWDVYLVYDAGVKWMGERAPQPSFWMHQLSAESGADPKLQLKPEKLQKAVEKRLAELAGKAQ